MLFDTHAHYYAEQFDPDRDELLSCPARCQRVGLVLCPGCDLESSRQSIALAEQYPFLYAAAGVHPEDALGLPDDWLEQVEAMTHHPKVKAVGEIGLDYYWQEVPRDRANKRSFAPSSPWRRRLDMPVIVHDREAHGDSLAIVKEFPWRPRRVPLLLRQRGGRQDPHQAGLAPVLHRHHHLQKRPQSPGGHRRRAPGPHHGRDTMPPTWPPRPTAASGATPATSTAWPKPSPRSKA